MRKPKRTCDPGRAIHPEIAEEVKADYRTGLYSQNQLAEKHVISKGLVSKLVKGLDKDLAETVTAGIAYKSTLYEKSKIEVGVLEKLTDERARDTAFFNRAQRKLAIKGMQMIDKDDVSIQELTGVSTVLQTSRLGILGKPSDNTTNIQINNAIRIEELLGDL